MKDITVCYLNYLKAFALTLYQKLMIKVCVYKNLCKKTTQSSAKDVH